MAKILLGCLVGSMPKTGILAVSALLDFIYLAQYTTHDSITLGYLQDTLNQFHQYRNYFLEIGVREDFNIPKFHSLLHYIDSIKVFGTTDNYNTEMFERLHIDFAKEGWRASNHRDAFPQMISWLSRQEKIASFEVYLSATAKSTQSQGTAMPKNDVKGGISLTKHPNHPNRPIAHLQEKYHAVDLNHCLKLYLSKFDTSPLPTCQLLLHSLPFTKVDVYDMFRFHPDSLQDAEVEKDIVKAMPPSKKLPHGRFDPVVVMVSDNAESTGLTG
jgi:hypothetical protein